MKYLIPTYKIFYASFTFKRDSKSRFTAGFLIRFVDLIR